MIDPEDEPIPTARPMARQFVALLVIGTATSLSLGLTLRTRTQLEANDISRWCTVWSLVERGTYAIDDCPWQSKTQDKVRKVSPFEKDRPGAPEHYYSSKPALLPSMIAGILYPIRKLTGVPLDAEVLQPRTPRPDRPDQTQEPVRWPVYVFYFKSTIVALNVLPYLIFLILFARYLDRTIRNDWAWFAGLVSAAWATPLIVFNTTLNNHSVAAYSAFFAVYALLRIWDTPRPSKVAEHDLGQPVRTPYGLYAAAGFFGAFAACNELPAASFGILLFLCVLVRSTRATLLAFVPAAAIPCVAFLATLYFSTGGFTPFYAEFGGPSYEYEGSYWTHPLEMDWFDKHPEPWWIYLLHLTIGHHGMFSLTPVFLLGIVPMLRGLFGVDRRIALLAGLTFVLTVGLFAFYTWKTHNYGGSTQGQRWLFWIYPFWLMLAAPGFEPGQSHRGFRWFGLICLVLSVFSVGYGLQMPWSHPWILDLLEHLKLYSLTR
ncbi:MAG TPA: hypothetical protein VGH33_28330 [Isosphaeraceae bacterium]